MVREEEVGGRVMRETATPQLHGGGSNIDPAQRNVNNDISEGPSQAQAQTSVYFPTIAENSMT